MLWLARLLPAMGLILLCISLVLGNSRAQMTPAAPTVDSVASGDVSLTVTWTAPADETGITAYDVRHIETSEDETDDTKWMDCGGRCMDLRGAGIPHHRIEKWHTV